MLKERVPCKKEYIDPPFFKIINYYNYYVAHNVIFNPSI